MRNYLLATLAIAAICAMMFGCSTSNINQVGHSSTLHGAGTDIGIPLGSYGKLGVRIYGGYMQDTDFINPTGTNVTAAPLGFVSHSRNRQVASALSALGSGTSTNANANALDGSDDSTVIFAGPVNINDGSTNRNTVVQQK